MSETVAGRTTDLYYNDAWQVVEERVPLVLTPVEEEGVPVGQPASPYAEVPVIGSTVSTQVGAQYLWSPAGSDALVYRDRDADGNGTLDERLYAQRDAQGDVTALVNAAGAVVERYAYDAYGAAKAYGATWVERTGGSQVGWRYLHQGVRYGAADQLILVGQIYDHDSRLQSFLIAAELQIQTKPAWFLEILICGRAEGSPKSARNALEARRAAFHAAL